MLFTINDSLQQERSKGHNHMMKKHEAALFFKDVLNAWETGSIKAFTKVYDSDYIEERHGKIVNLELLIKRLYFIHKYYEDVHYRLLDFIILKDNKYFVMSKFYANDVIKQKPAQMIIATVAHIKDYKILEAWTISTKEIYIASDGEAQEDLTVESEQRKKFEDLLTLTFKDKINLSKREKDCLYFYLVALPLKNIAKKLNISPTTVETHLRNIKRKCGVSSKAKLKDMFKLI